MSSTLDSGMITIGRPEWRWLLYWTIAVLVFTSIPYLMGWQTASSTGLIFGGFVIGVEDGNSYLAKMAQGSRGHWMFHIVYTSEPHDGAFFFVFYLLLGKVAALLAPSGADLPEKMIAVYHLARLLSSGCLLVVVYRFVSEFLQVISHRRLAWLMIALGGGLGWLLVASGHDNWLGSPPLDFILPEGFTFLTLFSLPHIALGRALLLGGMLIWFTGIRMQESDRPGAWKRAALAGALWLLMGLLVPFYPVVAGVVVVGTLFVWWLVRRHFPTKAAVYSLAAGLILSPVVFYSLWVFSANPVMQGWSAQNLILSPPLPHYLSAYLVPALMCVAGIHWVWSERPAEKYWLLVAWALVVPPMLYAPFNLQRRLIEGYQAPLYILAVIGFAQVIWPRIKSRFGRPRLLATAWFSLVFPSSLFLVVGGTLVASSGQAPVFHEQEEVSTAAWLTENAPEGALVLSGYASGNFLPAWSPVRSYLGHGPETIDFFSKETNVRRFFTSDSQEDWRRQWLIDNSVNYVLHGPAERELGAFRPDRVPYLKPVFEIDGWALYEFQAR